MSAARAGAVRAGSSRSSTAPRRSSSSTTPRSTLGTIITAEGPPHRDFVFTGNIVSHNTYGIAGTGVGTGSQALDALFPGAVVRRNVFVGGSAAQYPRDNFFVRSWAQVKFEDLAQGRVRLAEASPFRRASLEGTDLGVDVAALPDAHGPAPDR